MDSADMTDRPVWPSALRHAVDDEDDELIGQAKLDGTVQPTFATEAERQGFKETQLPLGIGPGELPLEDLPMFKKEEQRE